jgi:hypothetical protein
MVKRPAQDPPEIIQSSQTSTTSSPTNSEFAVQTPARKRVKFDENDLDWLIGDLRKEEAQLIITRLAKVFFFFFFKKII